MTTSFVPDGLDGERADVAAARMTGYSRSRVEQLARDGRLLVDGEPATKSTRVRAGALLELAGDSPERVVKPRPLLADGLEVVHDDPDIVVVDKPPFVASHPSLGWTGPTVTEHLAAAGFTIATSGAPERQGVVQRLDVGTSGLMVVAKSETAYSVLKQAFRDHVVAKSYHALVQGYPDPSSGTIDAPIGHAKSDEWKMAVRADGRPSVTHYTTLEAFRAATLLEVGLETGRTHQIRVHLAAVHHPCVGDRLYGADPTLAARLGLARQWLHAHRLAFDHPTTGAPMAFTSPAPADLAAALDILRD
ncbi:MAG: RluA family pseudouridine synthase [Propionibacteriaceae bacterium]|nr:RluA family pseudouridine synthase [Propionibacteriaceae bacterium]